MKIRCLGLDEDSQKISDLRDRIRNDVFCTIVDKETNVKKCLPLDKLNSDECKVHLKKNGL